MKQFKNTFSVTGTPKQLEAFCEWAEGIGWKKQDWDDYPAIIFCGVNGGRGDLEENHFWRNYHVDMKLIFQLPTQWAEAMQAASETVEPVIIPGGLYKDIIYGSIVICTGVNNEKTFQGTIIKGSIENEFATHRTDWLKSSFTLHEEPVTI